MESYEDDITDEELAFLLELKRKKKIKLIAIITSVFVVLTAFIAFSVVAYNYNPSQNNDEIVIRNEF